MPRDSFLMTNDTPPRLHNTLFVLYTIIGMTKLQKRTPNPYRRVALSGDLGGKEIDASLGGMIVGPTPFSPLAWGVTLT